MPRLWKFLACNRDTINLRWEWKVTTHPKDAWMFQGWWRFGCEESTLPDLLLMAIPIFKVEADIVASPQKILPLHRLWLIPFFDIVLLWKNSKRSKLKWYNCKFSALLSTFLCFLWCVLTLQKVISTPGAEASADSKAGTSTPSGHRATDSWASEEALDGQGDGPRFFAPWPGLWGCTWCKYVYHGMLGMI